MTNIVYISIDTPLIETDIYPSSNENISGPLIFQKAESRILKLPKAVMKIVNLGLSG